jgi:hypothetical protein
MFLKYFIGIFIIYLFHGCNQSEGSRIKKKYINMNEPPIIKLNNILYQNFKLNINTFQITYIDKINDQYILIDARYPFMSILNNQFKPVKSLLLKGNSFKKMLYISSFRIINNKFYLYDGVLRKMVVYDNNLNFIDEKKFGGKELPFFISSFISINKNMILCVGIDHKGYQDLMKGKEYFNFFIIDIKNFSLVKKFSLHLPGIQERFSIKDVSTSASIVPYKLTSNGNAIYLYKNGCREMLSFSINNEQKKPENIHVYFFDFLQEKKKMNLDEYHNPKNNFQNAKIWLHSGENISRCFADSTHIYLQTFFRENEQITKRNLYVINQKKLLVSRLITYPGNIFLLFIDKKYAYFSKENYEDNESNNEIIRIQLRTLQGSRSLN